MTSSTLGQDSSASINKIHELKQLVVAKNRNRPGQLKVASRAAKSSSEKHINFLEDYDHIPSAA